MGITSAIISAGAATLTSGGFAAGTFLATAFGTSALSAFLVRAAVGVALYALSPKPSTGQGANRGYQVTTRGSARDHQIVYGEARVGSVVVYDNATGTTTSSYIGS